jgi:CRP-like cAMP-binding protein
MSLVMSLKILNHPLSEFKKGEVVVKESSPGGKVYVLASGSVAVTLAGQLITSCSEKGETFGEIASIRGCNYGATVTATEDSKFYVINDFLTYLRQNPDDSIDIMKMLCERIVKMNLNLIS